VAHACKALLQVEGVEAVPARDEDASRVHRHTSDGRGLVYPAGDGKILRADASIPTIPEVSRKRNHLTAVSHMTMTQDVVARCAPLTFFASHPIHTASAIARRRQGAHPSVVRPACRIPPIAPLSPLPPAIDTPRHPAMLD